MSLLSERTPRKKPKGRLSKKDSSEGTPNDVVVAKDIDMLEALIAGKSFSVRIIINTKIIRFQAKKKTKGTMHKKSEEKVSSPSDDVHGKELSKITSRITPQGERSKFGEKISPSGQRDQKEQSKKKAPRCSLRSEGHSDVVGGDVPPNRKSPSHASHSRRDKSEEIVSLLNQVHEEEPAVRKSHRHAPERGLVKSKEMAGSINEVGDEKQSKSTWLDLASLSKRNKSEGKDAPSGQIGSDESSEKRPQSSVFQSRHDKSVENVCPLDELHDEKPPKMKSTKNKYEEKISSLESVNDEEPSKKSSPDDSTQSCFSKFEEKGSLLDETHDKDPKRKSQHCFSGSGRNESQYKASSLEDVDNKKPSKQKCPLQKVSSSDLVEDEEQLIRESSPQFSNSKPDLSKEKDSFFGKEGETKQRILKSPACVSPSNISEERGSSLDKRNNEKPTKLPARSFKNGSKEFEEKNSSFNKVEQEESPENEPPTQSSRNNGNKSDDLFFVLDVENNEEQPKGISLTPSTEKGRKMSTGKTTSYANDTRRSRKRKRGPPSEIPDTKYGDANGAKFDSNGDLENLKKVSSNGTTLLANGTPRNNKGKQKTSKKRVEKFNSKDVEVTNHALDEKGNEDCAPNNETKFSSINTYPLEFENLRKNNHKRRTPKKRSNARSNYTDKGKNDEVPKNERNKKHTQGKDHISPGTSMGVTRSGRKRRHPDSTLHATTELTSSEIYGILGGRRIRTRSKTVGGDNSRNGKNINPDSANERGNPPNKNGNNNESVSEKRNQKQRKTLPPTKNSSKMNGDDQKGGVSCSEEGKHDGKNKPKKSKSDQLSTTSTAVNLIEGFDTDIGNEENSDSKHKQHEASSKNSSDENGGDNNKGNETGIFPTEVARDGGEEFAKTLDWDQTSTSPNLTPEEKKATLKPFFICPHCNKKMKLKKSLKRHLDTKVCLKKTATSDNVKKWVGMTEKKTRAGKRKKLSSQFIPIKPMPVLDEEICINAEPSDSCFPPEKIGSSFDKGSNRAALTKNKSSEKKRKTKALSTEDKIIKFEIKPRPKLAKIKTSNRTYSPKPAGSGSAKQNSTKPKDLVPFYKLDPGTEFITKFGVVRVIVDNRLPPIHHRTKLSQLDTAAARRLRKKRQVYETEQERLLDHIRAGSRARREKMKKMYTESLQSNWDTTLLKQDKVWDLYCKSITPADILHEGMSWRNVNRESAEDFEVEKFDQINPLEPADYYPDRIVECELVKDGRQGLELGTPYNNHFSMRLYVTRRELTRPSNKVTAAFFCSKCWNFERTVARLQQHMHDCEEERKSAQVKRKECIKRAEANASASWSCFGDHFLKQLHSVTKRRAVCSFGNPFNIKEHKKNRVPTWMVFHPQRSAIYPELFVALGFRRGANNTKYFLQQKKKEGYLNKRESRNLAKKLVNRQKKQRIATPRLDSRIYASSPINSGKETCTKVETFRKKENNNGAIGSKSDNARSILRLGAPQCQFNGALDRNGLTYSGGEVVKINGSYLGSKRSEHLAPTEGPTVTKQYSVSQQDKSTTAKKQFENIHTKHRDMDGLAEIDHSNDPYSSEVDNFFWEDSDVQKGTSGIDIDPALKKVEEETGTIITPFKVKKSPIVIDVQVLAAECDTGRYPTMNRFNGEHDGLCRLCRKSDEYDPRVLCSEDEGNPLMDCDFCAVSFHQTCINRKMLFKDPPVILRESEPHDSIMCHECLAIVLFRRSRAENRRLSKWHQELRKAGLEKSITCTTLGKKSISLVPVPDAAKLFEEINLDNVLSAVEHEDEEYNYDVSMYKTCPSGGPGGLICCYHCSNSYTRFLSNVAKEMEAQSVAKVGQEVSEILELLSDAKLRLRRATELSCANNHRRSLL